MMKSLSTYQVGKNLILPVENLFMVDAGHSCSTANMLFLSSVPLKTPCVQCRSANSQLSRHNRQWQRMELCIFPKQGK